jgi:hypothetical protein
MWLRKKFFGALPVKTVKNHAKLSQVPGKNVIEM